jgi:hypothetical protein
VPTVNLPRHPTQAPRPFNDLPKRQREFLKHYVRLGDAREAYGKAGYTANSRSTQARVSKLMRELAPYLSEAFQRYIEGVEIGILGVKVIKDLAENAESEAVKLNAAKELKALSIKDDPAETVVHNVHHASLSNEQIEDRLSELRKQLWKDAPKLEVVSSD